jgi:phosphate transport system substrate-binding protein
MTNGMRRFLSQHLAGSTVQTPHQAAFPSWLLRSIVPCFMLGVALISAGCGGATSGGGGTGASLTACHVTAADLTVSGGSATPPAPTTSGAGLAGQTLHISGSTALQPLFASAASAFDATLKTQTTVDKGGSIVGLQQVEAGQVDIGMSDVFYQDKAITSGYTDLVDHRVAAVAFTVVVSADLKDQVQNLTRAQVQDIFAGRVSDWSDLGGPVGVITVGQRPATSGTRATFEQYVLGGPSTDSGNTIVAPSDSTDPLVAKLATLQGGIGYAATGFVLNGDHRSQIFPVCLDGKGATATNINGGDYPFWNYEHAYTKGTPQPDAQAFLDYVLSEPFQTTALPAQGFLQLGQLSETAKQTHPLPSGATS